MTHDTATLALAEDRRGEGSARWFRNLAMAMPALLVTLDPSGKYEFCSDSYLEYTGLTRAEATMWPATSLIHPDDRADALASWERSLSSGDALRTEVRLRRYDGEHRWFLVQGCAARDANGEIVRFITTSLDIHDRKVAEALADRRRRALEVIAEASRDFSELAFDLPRLLDAIARRSVDALGDGCAIQLLSDDGEMLTLGAVDHRNPRVPARVRAIFAERPNPARVGTAARVLAGSRAIFLPHADEALLRATTSPHLVALLDEVGVSSVIAMPLRAHGEVLGSMICTRDRGSEAYAAEDVMLVEELGNRAAIAIRQAKNANALHVSECTYRRLAESTPASVLVASGDGDALYYNDFFLDYVGRSREDLPGRAWLDLIHPADLARIIPDQEAALACGDEYGAECRLRRSDGVYRWHLGRRVRLSSADPGTERYVHVAIDIDERHRAEERQRLLMEASELATLPFDVDATLARTAAIVVPGIADSAAAFIVRDGSPSLAQLVGAGPDGAPIAREAIGASLGQMTKDWGVARAIATGESDIYPEFEHRWERLVAEWEPLKPFAQLAPRSFMVVAIKWQKRVFGALALASHDMYRRFTRQDLALAEEVAERAGGALENARLYAQATATATELGEANRAKDDFLGLVSHELRTPITVILGDAEVLRARAGQLDEESKVTALGDIHSEAERLNRIIENLLTMARAEQAPLETEPVHVARVVARVVERFRAQARGRAVALTCEAGGSLVDGTDFAVEHALRNFLSNADKYSPVEAAIEVLAETKRDEFVVSVMDRGPAVPLEETERIFEPFYRSSSTCVSGVGIGLAVSKRLIEGIGGRVWVELRVGGGLRAAFALPLSDEGHVDDSP